MSADDLLEKERSESIVNGSGRYEIIVGNMM